MINPEQLRECIVRPVVKQLPNYSEGVVELLMLTAAVESNMGYYLRQVKGPALGIFQMEPATHEDIWANFLAHRRHLAPVVSQFGSGLSALLSSLSYATAMARVHYLRVAPPVPEPADVDGLAAYWKIHYNTTQGAGTVEQAVQKYLKYTNTRA